MQEKDTDFNLEDLLEDGLKASYEAKYRDMNNAIGGLVGTAEYQHDRGEEEQFIGASLLVGFIGAPIAFLLYRREKLKNEKLKDISNNKIDSSFSEISSNKKILKYKNYSISESIVGLLVIVSYADRELDFFEKSSINHTINEFKKSGVDEYTLYKLWKLLEEVIEEEDFDDCIKSNYEIKTLIKKFASNLRYKEDLKTTLVKQLIAISTNKNINKCQYKTIKYIAKVLGLYKWYVDDVLKDLGIYYKSNKQNNQEKSENTHYKNPYDILEVSKDDDFRTIKDRYKELIKKFHPEFIKGKNLDEEFINFASNKMKEINWAYNEIKNKFSSETI